MLLLLVLELTDFEQVIIFYEFYFIGQIRTIKYVSQNFLED